MLWVESNDDAVRCWQRCCDAGMLATMLQVRTTMPCIDACATQCLRLGSSRHSVPGSVSSGALCWSGPFVPLCSMCAHPVSLCREAYARGVKPTTAWPVIHQPERLVVVRHISFHCHNPHV